MDEPTDNRFPLHGWRAACHEIIYEADTPAGRYFDLVLFGLILGSVLAVMLESVQGFGARHGTWLHIIEWAFTLVFTIEYGLRLACVARPSRYALSFFGIVDLLAILPTYLSLFFPGTRFLIVIRILRLLRVFRILKLARYLHASSILVRALKASRLKILVFIYTMMMLVVVIGAVMYVVEGEAGGFTSIPRAVYWAIVTLTTVGYGDISPQSPLGQVIASIVMIMGYGIIAVPTGIVTAELATLSRLPISTQACPRCSRDGHEDDAKFCKFCGCSLY